MIYIYIYTLPHKLTHKLHTPKNLSFLKMTCSWSRNMSEQ